MSVYYYYYGPKQKRKPSKVALYGRFVLKVIAAFILFFVLLTAAAISHVIATYGIP